MGKGACQYLDQQALAEAGLFDRLQVPFRGVPWDCRSAQGPQDTILADRADQGESPVDGLLRKVTERRCSNLRSITWDSASTRASAGEAVPPRIAALCRDSHGGMCRFADHDRL